MWIASVTLIIVLLLIIIVYYDIIPRIFGESYIEVEGYPIRRFENKHGFYHLQKKYFPGIWLDISRCDIIVPITSELPSDVSCKIESDIIYRRKFVEFKPTLDAEVALKFEQLLTEIYKNEPLIYKERVIETDKTRKYKPFIPGKDNETSIKKDRKI